MSKVSLKDAAKEAGYPYTTVWRRYQEGLIPSEVIGRTIIVDVEVVKVVMKAYEAGKKRRP